jgi:hypothetical protein
MSESFTKQPREFGAAGSIWAVVSRVYVSSVHLVRDVLIRQARSKTKARLEVQEEVR